MKIFVYGTLRKNHGNHFLLQDSVYLGQAKTEPKYTLACSGIPYLINGTEEVVGELYEVPPHVLNDLDMLEGHPDCYTRKDINLIFNDEPIKAQAYHWLHDDKKDIKTYPRYTDYASFTGRF